MVYYTAQKVQPSQPSSNYVCISQQRNKDYPAIRGVLLAEYQERQATQVMVALSPKADRPGQRWSGTLLMVVIRLRPYTYYWPEVKQSNNHPRDGFCCCSCGPIHQVIISKMPHYEAAYSNETYHLRFEGPVAKCATTSNYSLLYNLSATVEGLGDISPSISQVIPDIPKIFGKQ